MAKKKKIRELQEIGYEFKPGYVDSLLKSETARIELLKAKKAEKNKVTHFIANKHSKSILPFPSDAGWLYRSKS